MASEPSPPESLPAIQNEHQELLSLVKSIKRRLASSPWQDPMVPSLLDSLREHLESHFEFEESDDGFDHLVQKAPWVEPRVEALIAEHRKMLSSACELAAEARSSDRTAPRWEQLKASFGALEDELTVHEAKEHDLLQEVYTQDVGDKD
ncbi:MAG: hypothetical protein KDB61_11705 [Planctomycetes bacterium]|nr:hypothetical protein [Planctomycetota bacterium]